MADDWVESRQRSYQGVKTAMSGGDPDSLSPGAVEVRDRFAVDFHHTLFDRPDVRKLIGAPELAELGGITASTLRSYISRRNSEVPLTRDSRTPRCTRRPRPRWVLRQRNKESVAEVADAPHARAPVAADGLAWSVAVSLDEIVSTEHLGRTVRASVLFDFTESLEMLGDDADEEGDGPTHWWHLNLTPSVAKTLDWYIRCFPAEAYATIGEIQRQAHQTWKAPAADTLSALRSALSLDGELTEQQRETYFALLEPHEDTN